MGSSPECIYVVVCKHEILIYVKGRRRTRYAHAVVVFQYYFKTYICNYYSQQKNRNPFNIVAKGKRSGRDNKKQSRYEMHHDMIKL